MVQIEENYVAPSLHDALADVGEPQADTTMSATEVGSKIYEPRTYDKAIANLIHGQKWKDAIEEELSNLEQHNTWEYYKLPSDRIAIGSK